MKLSIILIMIKYWTRKWRMSVLVGLEIENDGVGDSGAGFSVSERRARRSRWWRRRPSLRCRRRHRLSGAAASAVCPDRPPIRSLICRCPVPPPRTTPPHLPAKNVIHPIGEPAFSLPIPFNSFIEYFICTSSSNIIHNISIIIGGSPV